MEGASTAGLSLASHDDILPRGPPPSSFDHPSVPLLSSLTSPPSLRLRSTPSLSCLAVAILITTGA